MFNKIKECKIWLVGGLVFVLGIFLILNKDLFSKKDGVEDFYSEAGIEKPENELRVGWLSDIHYGDNNHDEKLATLGDDAVLRTVPQMIKDKADLIVVTGDLIDNFHKEHDEVITFHKEVKEIFDSYPLETFFVMGNHDVQTNTKKEFLNIYKMASTNYVFEKKGITFIALDQQFNLDGSSYDENEIFHIPGIIPFWEIEWFKKELEKAPGKVVVLTHQPIFSVEDEDGPGGEIYTGNGKIFQDILSKSDKILAVLSGHRQPSLEERFRIFDGVKHYIMPSAIFKDTRLSHGIVKINLENHDIQVDYYSNKNHNELEKKMDGLSEKCRGKDQEEDYQKIDKLKSENPREFERIEKMFKKYEDKDFRSSRFISEEDKETLKDFEDYDCFKRYLEARFEFAGY